MGKKKREETDYCVFEGMIKTREDQVSVEIKQLQELKQKALEKHSLTYKEIESVFDLTKIKKNRSRDHYEHMEIHGFESAKKQLWSSLLEIIKEKARTT